MSDYESANFLHHYQSISLNDSSKDDFEKTEIKRRLMTLTHAASLKLYVFILFIHIFILRLYIF